MTFSRLRAKSGDGSCESEFLPTHLADVFHAAERVLDATADAQLDALQIPVDPYRERLRTIVSVAAAVHDLGKANDHFQGMIYRTRDVRQNPQGLRHRMGDASNAGRFAGLVVTGTKRIDRGLRHCGVGCGRAPSCHRPRFAAAESSGRRGSRNRTSHGTR